MNIYTPHTGTGGHITYLTLHESARMVAQEQPMSCAAACIRQLLIDQGVYLTEKQVRQAAYTSDNGTSDTGLKEALKKLDHQAAWTAGFAVSTFSTEEVAQIFTSRGSWIAVVSPDPLGMYHSILIDKIEDQNVYIRDPWGLAGAGSEKGMEGIIKLSNFVNYWENTGNFAAWRR